MFEFTKQAFIVLVLMLWSFAGSIAIKCVTIDSQPCMVRPKLIDFNPDEFHYYPCIIRMNWCNGSCNSADDPVRKIYVPNKMGEGNLKVFHMIKRENESKTLAKTCLMWNPRQKDKKIKPKTKTWDKNEIINMRQCIKPIKYRAWNKDYAWNPNACLSSR